MLGHGNRFISRSRNVRSEMKLGQVSFHIFPCVCLLSLNEMGFILLMLLQDTCV